jgi:hypothetical protein
MKLSMNFFMLLSYFGLIYPSRAQESYLTNDLNTAINADSSGIYSEYTIFSPDRLFPKKEWQGNWIWLDMNEFAAYQSTYCEWINNNEKTKKQYKALFRKNFDLKNIPSMAILSITADVSFRAYLNGHFICQGPVNIGSDYLDTASPAHWFYTIHDVKKYLQPYFMYYVLSAISHIDQFDTAGLALLNKWRQAIDLETYTLKENWQEQTESGYVGDFSHAWGGSPLYFMSRLILGIAPGKPGYQEIRIDPYISDHLTWAKGTIPLNNGQITRVSWERPGTSVYKYSIEIPKHHKAVLHHPAELMSYDIRINNKVYDKTARQTDLSHGKYLIEYSWTD